MLYISRRVMCNSRICGYQGFGVFDTDDCTEQIISADELADVVNKDKIPVAGIRRGWDPAEPAAPWQSKESLTQAQLKARMALSIEVTLWNNMITNITWPRGAKGVNIRLSDFAPYCADFIFMESSEPSSPMTIILDDKLNGITDWSLIVDTYLPGGKDDIMGESWMRRSLRFDIRALTKPVLVESVYKQMLAYGKEFSLVIDSPRRKEAMKQRSW